MPALQPASFLPRLFTLGLLATCLPEASSVARAEMLVSSAAESSASGWTGFSGGFEPNWVGETKRINWRRPGGFVFTSLNWIRGGGLGWTYLPPKQIELVDATRFAHSNSISNIYAGSEHARADESAGPDSSKAGSWSRTLAYYAEVIDIDDLTLGKARSLAAMQSELTDDAFSMTSRIAADAFIDPIVNDWSRVTGAAGAGTELVYRFSEPTRVDLAGRFRHHGGVDFNLTLKDHDTGEVLYEQFRSAYALLGEDLSFSFTAEVSPGLYDLAFSADSSHEVSPAATQEHGGMGEFALGFRALPLNAGDFDGSGAIDSDDLDLWQAHFGRPVRGDADGDGDYDYLDYDAWREGSHASDLTGDGGINGNDFEAFLAADSFADADGSGAADGRDFLLWQRTLDPPSAATIEAVPEPSIAVLTSAALTCLAAGSNRRR